jgi:hypothetical protein
MDFYFGNFHTHHIVIVGFVLRRVVCFSAALRGDLLLMNLCTRGGIATDSVINQWQLYIACAT